MASTQMLTANGKSTDFVTKYTAAFRAVAPGKFDEPTLRELETAFHDACSSVITFGETYDKSKRDSKEESEKVFDAQFDPSDGQEWAPARDTMRANLNLLMDLTAKSLPAYVLKEPGTNSTELQASLGHAAFDGIRGLFYLRQEQPNDLKAETIMAFCDAMQPFTLESELYSHHPRHPLKCIKMGIETQRCPSKCIPDDDREEWSIYLSPILSLLHR